MSRSADEIASFHDEIFLNAVKDQFSNLTGEEFDKRIKTHMSASEGSSAKEHLRIYRESKFHDADSEARFLDLYFEVKLQLYYLTSAVPDEWCAHTACLEDGSELSPHGKMKRVALIQGRIGQIRILWEKTMNLVFFLETNEMLEAKVSGNKSKQKVFFDTVEKSEAWAFISEHYKELFRYFDDEFRTPEAHKGSVLKKEITGQRKFDDQVVSAPVTVVCNSILPTMRYVMRGLRQSPQIIRVRAFEQESHERKGTPAPDFGADMVSTVTVPGFRIRFDGEKWIKEDLE